MIPLKAYVYRNLKEYGNCVIGYPTVRKYGQEAIVTYLKQQGYVAQFHVVYEDKRKLKKSATYIIELK